MLVGLPSLSKILTIVLLVLPAKTRSGSDDALITRLNISVSSTILSLIIAMSNNPRVSPANIVTS